MYIYLECLFLFTIMLNIYTLSKLFEMQNLIKNMNMNMNMNIHNSVVKDEQDVVKDEQDVVKDEQDVIKDEQDVIKDEQDVVKDEQDVVKDEVIKDEDEQISMDKIKVYVELLLDNLNLKTVIKEECNDFFRDLINLTIMNGVISNLMLLNPSNVYNDIPVTIKDIYSLINKESSHYKYKEMLADKVNYFKQFIEMCDTTRLQSNSYPSPSNTKDTLSLMMGVNDDQTAKNQWLMKPWCYSKTCMIGVQKQLKTIKTVRIPNEFIEHPLCDIMKVYDTHGMDIANSRIFKKQIKEYMINQGLQFK